jgi:predicted lipid carrier protein YhbT
LPGKGWHQEYDMLQSFNIPTFRLPTLIASIGSRLPQWPHSCSVVAAMNIARSLKLLPEDSLAELEGRRFRVSVLDTGGIADFTFAGGSFKPIFRPLEVPDLSFSANLSAYLQLLTRQEDPDTLFFNRQLVIEGDTELGLVVKNMLDAVEWSRLPLPPFLKRAI